MNMPWHGWNEDQVCGSIQQTSQTSQRSAPMAGFTPINAPISRQSAPSRSQLEGGTGASDQHPTRTVASGYLGRDEDLPAAPPPQKPSTKGQKRAVTAGDAAKTNKRRCSSNVDHSIQITKSRGHDEQLHKPSEDDKPATSSKAKRKATASKQPKKTAGMVSAGNAEAGIPTTKPVSVYAQATSMDALDSTSARTSLDSVRASAGQSFTQYQAPSSNSSFQANLQFSQPLLKPASDAAHINLSAHTDIRGADKHGDAITNLLSDNDRPPHERPTRRSTRPKKAVNYKVEQSFPNVDITEDARPDSPTPATAKARTRRSTATFDDDDEFGELPEDAMEELANEVEKAVEERRPLTPPPRNRKQNMREVNEHEDYGGALLSDAERQLLAKMKNISDGKIKPIVRKPFLPATLDRSPIFGASKSSVLRTSFRVGEALNFGAQAVRCNDNAIIELYARATMSKREGRKQHFVFKDLYHNKPPYLEGTYELWDQALLWDLDSKPFLNAKGPGILSRVIARMKREGQKWRLDILNVWEASWEDVDYVAGIYTGEMHEDEDDM